MLSLILGIITHIKIGSYKKTRNYADAKSAGTLGTVTLVFTILQLIPLIIFGLAMLAVIPEMIEDVHGDPEEISYLILAAIIMLAPSIGLTIFGFSASSKGRKLLKSVETFGDPDYIPVSERSINTGYTYNQSSYGYNQNQNGYSYNYNSYSSNTNTSAGGNGSINSGFYNSSGLYGNANTANTHNTTNIPVQPYGSANTVTPSPTDNDCNYGRNDTGYIPHPESATEHCTTHNFESYGNKKWKCPSCNKTNKAEESFCRNCGTNRTASF